MVYSENYHLGFQSQGGENRMVSSYTQYMDKVLLAPWGPHSWDSQHLFPEDFPWPQMPGLTTNGVLFLAAPRKG